jgi:hypothetical protein
MTGQRSPLPRENPPPKTPAAPAEPDWDDVADQLAAIYAIAPATGLAIAKVINDILVKVQNPDQLLNEVLQLRFPQKGNPRNGGAA